MNSDCSVTSAGNWAERVRRAAWAMLALALASCQTPAMADSDDAPAGRPERLILGQDNGHVAIVAEDRRVIWSVDTPVQAHDVQRLPSGHVLLPIASDEIVEMTPARDIVWRYKSQPKPGYSGRIEVHAFQRLDDGNTMIAESGNAQIVEVSPEGDVVKTVPLTVDHPDAHRDTRMVRKLKSGGYLVCHEGDGTVREYDAQGNVVWSYALSLQGREPAGGHGPEAYGVAVYGAIRLENGNTLIAGGNNHRVLEVTPDGEVVWSIDQKELPGITLAWVTTLHALPNGNIIIGNCHAGPGQPQLIEVTRDKEVVWTFENFETFGDGLAAVEVLGVPEGTIH